MCTSPKRQCEANGVKKLQQVPDKCPQVPSAWDGLCPHGGLWAVSSLLQRMAGSPVSRPPAPPQNGKRGCLNPKGGLGCGGDWGGSWCCLLSPVCHRAGEGWTGACSSRSAPCHGQLMEEIWTANFVHPPAVFSPRLRLCWDFGQQHHHIPVTNPIHARQLSGNTAMSEEPFPGVPEPRILQLPSPVVHQARDSLIHLH